MTGTKPVSRRRWGLGYSIPAAARVIGGTPRSLREAIRRNQVAVEDYAGMTIISPAEVERLRRLRRPDVE